MLHLIESQVRGNPLEKATAMISVILPGCAGGLRVSVKMGRIADYTFAGGNRTLRVGQGLRPHIRHLCQTAKREGS